MKIQKADYLIPNEGGDGYDKVHFSTSSDQVEESENKKFVNNETSQFLTDNLKNILLQENIVNDFSSNATNKVASANTIKILNDLLGGVKIVVSDTEPNREPDKIILWINTKEEEE